jgi:hypothetical protein
MRGALLLLAACGCTGVIGASERPEETAAAAPEVAKPNGVRIVRLTHRAYQHTLEDLTGEKISVALPADGAGNGFDNTASVMTVSESLAIEYRDIARRVADGSVDRLFKCDDDACARGLVTTFGKRAFRRPLRDEEIEGYFGLYSRAKASIDARTGARLVIETMLQSPSFLYRTELTEVRLDPYEIASALSYVLWETMPDEALFAAADRGAIDVAAEARRMLRDARARGPVVEMFKQMLDLHALRDATRPVDDFAGLSRSMQEESRLLIEDVVFERRGSLGDLLTVPYTFVDDRLSSLYGYPVAGAPGYVLRALPSHRLGILGTSGFLTAHATPLASSPPRRGKVVAERFLCLSIAPPPPEVAAMVPTSGSGTTRDKFAEHTKNATCRGCHSQLDPLGFAFESFDQLGRYRTIDNGLPVDAKTTLSFGDVTGDVNGAAELSKKLAASADVRRCFARQAMRWSLGRLEGAADEATVNAIAEQPLSVEDVLVALVTSDSFLKRTR